MSSAAAAGFNKRDFVSSGAPEDPDVAAAARDASISRGRLPLSKQNFFPFMQIKFDNLVPIHKFCSKTEFKTANLTEYALQQKMCPDEPLHDGADDEPAGGGSVRQIKEMTCAVRVNYRMFDPFPTIIVGILSLIPFSTKNSVSIPMTGTFPSSRR